MSHPLNLDREARAELLAYLVSSHLLARHLTGDWLSTAHVVESTSLWLRSNGAGADVMQRVMLTSLALEIAQHLESAQLPALPHQTLSTLFTEKLRIDFRLEAARTIDECCLTWLDDQDGKRQANGSR